MKKPPDQVLPELGNIDSQVGVRLGLRSLWRSFGKFLDTDHRFKGEVTQALTPLYGETAYAPGALGNGAQAAIAITVPGASLGWVVDIAYDQTLQALQATAYVSALDTVTVVLKNDTGGNITLAAGRWRAYVWPQILSA